MDNLISIFNASKLNSINFKELTMSSYCNEIMKHTSMIFDYLYTNRSNIERKERRRILIDCGNNTQLGFILSYMKEQFFDSVIDAPNIQLFYKQNKNKIITNSNALSTISNKKTKNENKKDSKKTNLKNKNKTKTKNKKNTKARAETKVNKTNKSNKKNTKTKNNSEVTTLKKSETKSLKLKNDKSSNKKDITDIKTPQFGADNVWVK